MLALTESNPRFGAYFYASVSEKLGRLAQRAGQRELQTLLTATVRDANRRRPVFIDGGASLRDTAAAMKAQQSKSVLVRAEAGLGIFTTTDFRDIVLNGVSADAPVAAHCNYQLLTIDIDDFLFNALLLMTRRNLRRLVVTEGGAPVGMLAQVDVLSYFSNHSHLIAQRLERADTLDELAEIAAQITRLVRILCGHGVKPLQLGRLVQSLNARLFARAWRLIAPPELLANSCLLVLGSEGRGEQILKTDQDNALLLRDGAHWPQLEASCQAFSDALERFGYPPCPGGIMLSRPGWRFSGAELRQRFQQWVHQPSGDALMRLAIFVDAEAVCGDSELLERARDELHAALRDDAGFFSRFARAIEQFDTPLGLFSHLQTQARDGRTTLDLKKAASSRWCTASARWRWNTACATTARSSLRRLVELERLDAELAEDVGEALSFLMQLRLEHGLEQQDAGRPADNLLEPEKLSSLERDLLRTRWAWSRNSRRSCATITGWAVSDADRPAAPMAAPPAARSGLCRHVPGTPGRTGQPGLRNHQPAPDRGRAAVHRRGQAARQPHPRQRGALSLVRPERAPQADNVRIHGLRPIDVSQGLAARDAVRQLLDFIGGRPLLGYYLEYDLAVLNRYVRPWLGVPLPQRRIEISGRYYDYKLRQNPDAHIDLSLASICRDLDMPTLPRHDALNDAINAAMLYLALKRRGYG